jgi:hypothetical protein
MNDKLQDWQTGDKSKINSLNRMMYHTEWLKQQHLDIKKMIQSKIIVEDKPTQGFIKD